VNRSTARLSAGVVAALFVLGLVVILVDLRSVDVPGGADGVGAIEQAFQTRQSELWVEVDGVVVRLLGDDREGARHQRFIIELAGGHTVLVSHNIDLAPYVPLALGDEVTVRGEYVWNERGGLLHWTHHDPTGQEPGGWVRLRGQTYR